MNTSVQPETQEKTGKDRKLWLLATELDNRAFALWQASTRGADPADVRTQAARLGALVRSIEEWAG